MCGEKNSVRRMRERRATARNVEPRPASDRKMSAERPRFVERVILTLHVRPDPAVVRSTAIVIRTEQPRPPPRQATNQSQQVSTRLMLCTRYPLPHELAGENLNEVASVLPRGATTVRLSDGSFMCAEAAHLAAHSPMLCTLLNSSANWREGAIDGTCSVALPEHDAMAVRYVAEWMSAADGREKRAVAEKMLSADRVVGVARLAHYLEVPSLLDAAIAAIGLALDEANAPSILLLARELQHTGLEEQATRFTLASLDAVEAEAEYWHELPQATRNTLRLLRTATLTNPLLSASGRSGAPPLGAEVACSGRELLAMVRESLAELHERFADATKRQALEPTGVRQAQRKIRIKGHLPAGSSRLVLGWINADFRVQIRVLQHFSRSTRISSSRKQI